MSRKKQNHLIEQLYVQLYIIAIKLAYIIKRLLKIKNDKECCCAVMESDEKKKCINNTNLSILKKIESKNKTN